MEEETEKKTTPEETIPAAQEPVEQKQSNTTIDEANKAAERLEKAYAARDKQLEREEKLEVMRRLGGRSDLSEKETEEDKIKKGARALIPDGMDCPGVSD